MQQLNHYDYRDIKEYEVAINLAEDIAITALSSGMMKGKKATDIRKAIKVFLTPEMKKSHGRPIYSKEAAKCGLNIEEVDGKDDVSKLIYELYVRINWYVSNKVVKSIESKDLAFAASPS